MTSEERRKGRRDRREAERKKKHEDYIRKYNDFNLVLDLDNLKAAYRKSRRGVAWKESVQRYDLFLMSNLAETKQKLVVSVLFLLIICTIFARNNLKKKCYEIPKIYSIKHAHGCCNDGHEFLLVER